MVMVYKVGAGNRIAERAGDHDVVRKWGWEKERNRRYEKYSPTSNSEISLPLPPECRE